jgi:hypothetical protein
MGRFMWGEKRIQGQDVAVGRVIQPGGLPHIGAQTNEFAAAAATAHQSCVPFAGAIHAVNQGF